MSVLDFSPLKFTSILWLVLSVYFRFAHGGGGEFECSREVHQEIRRLAVNCEPREQVVALPLPNSSYMAVTPSHVTVKRCGGACNRRLVDNTKQRINCLPNKKLTLCIFTKRTCNLNMCHPKIAHAQKGKGVQIYQG